MSKAMLYEFRVSHFCEKARWALDHHGIDYDVSALAPGMHLMRLSLLGVPGTSVPVLRIDGRTIQGSGEIVSFLDARDAARSLTPDGALGGEARALEAELDDAFGRDLRAVAYDVLLRDGPVVQALWSDHQPFWVPLAYRAIWPRAALNLRKFYRLSPENCARAKVSMERAMDALDARLASGRRYLVGDRLSRADVAACALLSPFVTPPQRPWQPPRDMPGAYQELIAPYRARPFWRWVEDRYATDRAPAGSA